MFYLMNEARLGVSAQALGIAQKAFEEAKEYAAERKQFGKPIEKHELIREKLLDMETDIKAMRSLIYKACEYDDLKAGLEEKIKENPELEPEYKKYKHLAREMIPLVKYFASEKTIQIARDALQIHGGNGFTTDYTAELHLRDSIITAIYEGTSQIQSLMATSDTLKKSKILPYWEIVNSQYKNIKKTFNDDLTKKAVEAEICFNNTVEYLKRPFAIAKVKKDKKLEEEALSNAMANAERLTRIKAYKTIIDILVDEAQEFPERKEIAERFIRNYVPEMRKELDIIKEV